MRPMRLPFPRGPATRTPVRARRKRLAPLRCEAPESRLVLSAGEPYENETTQDEDAPASIAAVAIGQRIILGRSRRRPPSAAG